MTSIASAASSRGGSNGRPIRIGWLTIAPNHYHSPLYRVVAADRRIDLTVIYITRDGLDPYDGGYAQSISWDIDLLSGYRCEFVKRARQNHLPMKGLLQYRDLDVARAVRRGHFDVLVLHGYNSITHQLAALAQLSLGRPVVFREEQTLLMPRPAWKTVLKQAWLRPVFRRSSALCIGTANEEWFARWGIPEGRRFLAPYAAANERLKRDLTQIQDARVEVRRELGLPVDESPVILAVGRLIPQKGPLILLQAFARLRARMPSALMYVGSGPLGPAIEAESRRLGLKDVHFPGFIEQSKIVRAYLASDLLVLPSVTNEPWGMVVNEAMVCGLPVIVSDRVGSGSDLVRNGVNGFVVKAGDVDALERGLVELVSSSEMRRRFGAASSELIQDWTHERAAAALATAVASAVGPERWSAASGMP